MKKLPFDVAFFRQSGWLAIATMAGGVFMVSVQSFAQRRLSDDEYSVFSTLLQMIAQMGIPALGLQTVFAQQSVSAGFPGGRRDLASAVRSVMAAMFGLWLLGAVLFFLFRGAAQVSLRISDGWALFNALLIALVTLMTPVLMGVLQGRQQFAWLGWANMMNGVGRLAGLFVLTLIVGATAAGAIGGVLAGATLTFLVIGWSTRDLWREPRGNFHWGKWVGRLVPLTLGMGSWTYLFTQDVLCAQQSFSTGTGAYNAARTVGATLVFLTVPMTSVMFPKIVQSAARAEKTSVLAQALGATALVGGLAALACTILPSLPLRVISGTKYLDASPLVPWFAWGMLPLALANVLLNNLLARERFGVVGWVVGVAAAYGITLHFYHPSLLRVIQTMGLFGLLLLGITALYTWWAAHRHAVRLRVAS